MSADRPRYWFPAKPLSWGWDLTGSVKGKAVVGLFLAAVLVGSFFFHARQSARGYIVYLFVLCVLLALICWWKGEPLSRRNRE